MAVPKRKRYKQVVRHRRSLQETLLLGKKGLGKTKYGSFFNTKPGVTGENCFVCGGSKRWTLCLNCYREKIV